MGLLIEQDLFEAKQMQMQKYTLQIGMRKQPNQAINCPEVLDLWHFCEYSLMIMLKICT
jgi:hypothetical protein